MNGDPIGTQPLTHDQAAAWETYLDNTSEDRERYAKLVEDAHEQSQAAREIARYTHLAVDRDAWETYQAACCTAWHQYQDDTKAARQRRDTQIKGPYPEMIP